MNAAETAPTARNYIMLVGKAKPKQVFTGLESLVKLAALQKHMKTGKRVELLEIEYVGDPANGQVNVVREVKVYEAKK